MNLDEKSFRHNICDFRSKGKTLSEIISDHEKDECIILDDLSLKEDFLDITIKNEDQLSENVSFSYSTKDEINKRYDNKSIISEPIELNTEKDVNKFLIDEYENLYLLEKTGKDSKIYQITRSEDPYLERSKNWLEASQNLRKSKLKLIERDQNDCILDFIFQDLEDRLYHLISMDLKYNIVNYNVSNDLNNNIYEKNQDELTELPYSHGLEIELQLVKEDWSLIEGNRIENFYEVLLEKARKKLEMLRKDAPDYIKNNWRGEIKKDIDDKGCLTLHIQYALEGTIGQYSIFGKDSHVSLKTNILEIQTPPCKCIEEMEWWTFNLYRIAYEVIEESSLDISILPLGSNSVDDYSRGVTFGEHHHIYIQDKKLRKDVYNVLRSLVPYLIAVSSNSPFNEKRI
ncbi:MAG: glutamate-cysteine ligase family protein, partial [Thermoplasmatota archaeon]